ncbi:MAG: AMP-binding protein [Thermoleophilia bacterium]|nr:AMP-binding protein [Thermoleophilia bacterium]
MGERLSYAHGPADVPLRGETIGQAWLAAASEHAGRDALVACRQGIRLTYAELATEVERAARALLAAGVERGDRVALWSPNRAEWPIVQLAAARAGAILVSLNPAYRARELGYALEQSGTSLLVMAEGFRDVDYRETLAESGAVPRRAVTLGPEWEAFLAAGERIPADALAGREAALDVDDPASIQYTSGTTGFPKGATLSHHNMLNNGFFVGRGLGYGPADRVCLPVPFYHCFGMVLGTLACVTHGAAMVLPGEAFDPAAALAAVDAEACTSLYGVPTMFIAELEEPGFADHDLRSLRTGVMGGSPCPLEVIRRVRDELHMRDVAICYGMTETSPISTQTRPDAPLEQRVSTVGQAHPHVELRVADPATGRTVPRGTSGELCVRGYSVMLGYWEDDAATRRALDAGRWLHTGDLAVMGEDGHVSIVGRLTDLIIRGGENVYPRELEELLHSHPAVADVQVIGVPDPRYGEQICAWVVLRDAAVATEAELREFCAGRVAKQKVPRYIRFVDGFPLTATGKVQKFRMRKREIEERGLEHAAATPTA